MAIDVKTQKVIASPRLPAELVDSTSFLLKRLGFAAKGRSMDAFEEAGFTPYSFAVLAALDEASHETQGAIADTLGYDRSQMVGILDELEEQGLVERRRDTVDRRRHVVELTSDGKRALTKLRALTKHLDDEFLAPLTAAERDSLHLLLLKLAQRHEPRCAPLGTGN
jgi:DNA-binding MarR family transcriptional regulator